MDNLKDYYGQLIVGEGVTMEGDIYAPESAQIAGQMTGKLSTKAITLEASAFFDGEAVADSIHVYGKMKGNVHAREFLSVQSGGKVNGEIKHGELEVQRGGSISGNLQSLNNF
jgi:cytoskeletal protein CcmA (bactofilin family)